MPSGSRFRLVLLSSAHQILGEGTIRLCLIEVGELSSVSWPEI